MRPHLLESIRARMAAGATIDNAIKNAFDMMASEDRCECVDPSHGSKFPCFARASYRLRDGWMMCGTCWTKAHMPQIGDGDRR